MAHAFSVDQELSTVSHSNSTLCLNIPTIPTSISNFSSVPQCTAQNDIIKVKSTTDFNRWLNGYLDVHTNELAIAQPNYSLVHVQ